MAGIGCHRKMTAQNKDAGPAQCGGCHDVRRQALIEKLTDVPRMERNQPDAVMVKESNPGPVTKRMLPVPLDHKAHEGYADTCRGCHHAALTPCARVTQF